MMRSWHEDQCDNMVKTGKFPVPEFRRASGDVTCSICKKLYLEHPCNIPHWWLVMLCDGSYVKL